MGTGPTWSVFGENSFYQDTWGTRLGDRHVSKCSSDRPKQQYATGEPGKIYGWDGVGIVEASCEYRARGVSIRGKFVLSRNLRYEEERHVSERSSDRPAAVRQEKFSAVRVGIVEGSCGYRDRGGGSLFGENSIYRETFGTKRGSRNMATRNFDPTSSGTPRESRANFRGETVFGL